MTAGGIGRLLRRIRIESIVEMELPRFTGAYKTDTEKHEEASQGRLTP